MYPLKLIKDKYHQNFLNLFYFVLCLIEILISNDNKFYIIDSILLIVLMISEMSTTFQQGVLFPGLSLK